VRCASLAAETARTRSSREQFDFCFDFREGNYDKCPKQAK
jgi:hypothetical protein